MEALPDIDSPAKLLDLLEKCKQSGEEAPLQEMLQALEGMKDADVGLAGRGGADGVEVFPEPGFVVKTVTARGAKLFINVCSTSKMPLPPGWEAGRVPSEVKEHLEARLGGEAPPSMRIPLSMGQPRTDTDHNERPCVVLNAVVNPQLLAHCAQYRPLKYFLIQLVLGMAEKTLGMELDPQYRLPKMRYKGELPPPPARIQMSGQVQDGRLRRPSKPVIAEVPKESRKPAFALLASKRQRAKAPAAAAPPAAAPKGGGQPARTAEQQTAQGTSEQEQQGGQQLETLRPHVSFVGRPATAVTITVPLPAAVAVTSLRHARSVSCSVCAETVHVRAPGCQPLSVKLPFAVSAEGGTAEVEQGGGGGASLVLALPYRPFGSVLEELQEAARAAEGPASPPNTALAELD